MRTSQRFLIRERNTQKRGDLTLTPATKKQKKQEAPDKLRREAEKKLAALKARSALAEDRTPDQIIHELQVHQIELEMQNEALREAHLALETSWDKYIDLYEFAPVGYLTLTRTAVIAEGNLTGATMLGVDRRDLIKGRFRKFVDPADLERWDRYFVSVLHNAEKQRCDLVLMKADGSRFHARLESLRIDNKTGDPVVRVAISDITKEKQAEEILIRNSDTMLQTNRYLLAAGNELRLNEVRLNASLEEKEVLLAEVHHRVKNNLASFISLLSLDESYEDSEKGRELKKDLQSRARSMALIHETLYKTRNFSEVDMEFYLTTLISQIASTYGGSRKIHTLVDAGGIVLDLSRATAAGMIVNELITNSFKYAFPPSFDCLEVHGEPCTIRVTLALVDGSYVLSVADNGKGLPDSFNPMASKSLGLKLVIFLARHQLRSKTSVIKDNGTQFIFRLDKKGSNP